MQVHFKSWLPLTTGPHICICSLLPYAATSWPTRPWDPPAGCAQWHGGPSPHPLLEKLRAEVDGEGVRQLRGSDGPGHVQGWPGSECHVGLFQGIGTGGTGLRYSVQVQVFTVTALISTCHSSGQERHQEVQGAVRRRLSWCSRRVAARAHALRGTRVCQSKWMFTVHRVLV